jgi:HD-like signal output (HDOD) protein/CheY-like chemotaxis protein
MSKVMTEVLFVDDDLSTLEGLESRLKVLRDEWRMRFVSGAQAALVAMQEQPADVVVTDMKMADMDGAELLRQVRLRWPETVRLILSGNTSQDAVMRSLPVAHQFLAKPCDLTQLRQVIVRARALQLCLYSPGVTAAVGSLKSLPAVPRLFQALNQELNSGRGTAKSVAEIIEQDMAMTLRLLQLVNSAFFGLTRRVTHIREAVTYLGFEPIRSLVASAELFRAMSKMCAPKGFSLEEIQQHALRVGSLTQQLLTDREQQRTAFCASILHDIGRVALAVALPEDFSRTRELAEAKGVPLHQAEQIVFKCTHAEISAHILALWGLPNPLVEAVAFHHRPADLPEPQFGIAGAIHVADALDHLRPTPGVAKADPYDRFDREYLRSVGMLGELPKWIAATQAPAAA